MMEDDSTCIDCKKSFNSNCFCDPCFEKRLQQAREEERLNIKNYPNLKGLGAGAEIAAKSILKHEIPLAKAEGRKEIIEEIEKVSVDCTNGKWAIITDDLYSPESFIGVEKKHWKAIKEKS